MDLVSLESAATRANATVPEDLEQRIESALAAVALAEENVGLKASARPAMLDADVAQVSPETDARPATLAARPGGRRRLWLPLAGIVAAAAVALLLILPRTGQSQLKDTYDDPELAYAQIEETFKLISSKMADGVALAAERGEQAGKPAQIIDKINRK